MKASLIIFAVITIVSTILAMPAPRPETVDYGRPLAPLPLELVGPIRFDGISDMNWRTPGEHPFTGDVYSALVAQGVLEPERSRLVTRIANGDYDDIVCASRAGIESQKFHIFYAPGMAMTFREKQIAYNTVVAFKGQQCGRLYIEGRYHEWTPTICNNVTRLFPFFEASQYAASSRPNMVPGGVGPASNFAHRTWRRWFGPSGGISDRRAQPYTPLPDFGGAPINDVPEPSTIAMLVIGASVIFAFRRESK